MLRVEQLAYRYAGAEKPSLSGVSLSVARGQILGLLGPNGAGKTTLISHISGLLTIQSGGITIDGVALKKMRRQDPTRIAIAPQEYAFYPVLTVQENLSCFAAVSGLHAKKRKQRILDCIALTQLESHAHVRAEHLSGGLKRRLNLAIALLPEPDYLLLDEPTVGVDPQSRAFLLQVIRDLAASNVGIIYTTHYMEEVESLADEVVIVDHGTVLMQGTLADLLNTDATQSHVTLHADVPLDVLMQALKTAGIEVLNAEFGQNNLEHLFMSLTHRNLRG